MNFRISSEPLRCAAGWRCRPPCAILMGVAPEDWQRIETLFEQLIKLEGSDRTTRLDLECADDPELRRTLEGMLDSVDLDDSFLDSPVRSLARAEAQTDLPRPFGEFELVEEIGRGGMGVVYRAREQALGRDVAIKVLPQAPFQSARQLLRFEREARAAARLSHPGIVTVYSEGTIDGVRYFAMELVEGPSLLQAIRAARTPGPRSPAQRSDALESPADIASLIAGTAEALQVAHDAGVIHRDVKPSNLLLTPSGTLKLTDFGLVLDQREAAMSYSGEVFGTPHYISPEQAEGKSGEVDHRTDIYSLGVVLYELLTGVRPIEGETAIEVLRSVVDTEPRPARAVNRNVPLDLSVVCEVAMARRPADRYATAADMAADLRRILALEPIQARPLPRTRRAARWLRRHRSAVLTGTVTAFAALALVWAFREGATRLEIARRIEFLESQELVAPSEPESLASLTHVSSVILSLEEHGARLSDRQREVIEHCRGDVDLGTTTVVKLSGEAIVSTIGQTNALEPWKVDGAALAASAIPGMRANEIRRQLGMAELATEDQLKKHWNVAAPDGQQPGDPRAVVWIQEFDPLTGIQGEPTRVGECPCDFTTLAGHFLATVRWRGDVIAEYDRIIWAKTSAIRLKPALPAASQRGERDTTMALIDPQPVTYAKELGVPDHMAEVALEIPPFWLDRCEVSNAEFAEFVAEFPERVPFFWRFSANWDSTLERTSENYVEHWGELPVVGVTVSDAIAYAEWRGKRLPTYAELLYAGSGTSGRHYPWTESMKVEHYLGNCRQERRGGSTLEQYYHGYLALSVRVRSAEDASSPEGVYHLLGNVAELTSTLPIAINSLGELAVQPGHRVTTGGTWLAESLRQTIPRSHSKISDLPTDRSLSLGFRCARSH